MMYASAAASNSDTPMEAKANVTDVAAVTCKQTNCPPISLLTAAIANEPDAAADVNESMAAAQDNVPTTDAPKVDDTLVDDAPAEYSMP
mmetsp:Transcript_64123/g.75948  ORF Transcript_64123/g.75948 Transcript_64123/m.75948 type:complete len:89 (-) Transcript_64123:299-565(-)